MGRDFVFFPVFHGAQTACCMYEADLPHLHFYFVLNSMALFLQVVRSLVVRQGRDIEAIEAVFCVYTGTYNVPAFN